MKSKLNLDPQMVSRASTVVATIADNVTDFISQRTTESVERTVLRLFGVDGIDAEGVPLPNVVVDAVHEAGLLSGGVTRPFMSALIATGLPVQELAEAVADGTVDIGSIPLAPEADVQAKAKELAAVGMERIRQNRRNRDAYLARLDGGQAPLLYVIVATGNIYEDVVQARAAARQGADIIAVIRSTGQSLLDYVPYGPTT